MSGGVFTYPDRIRARLDVLLPAEGRAPQRLHSAMRYACLGSGKLVRPSLCMLVNEAAGGGRSAFALDAACAVEMVHCASLLLDDLPCMDDAGMRRGKPATHIAYGMDTAILASIGLLNLAFRVVADSPDGDAELKVRATKVLSGAIGSDGLIAGQEIDLNDSDTLRAVPEIERLYWLKTSVLFVASAELGALAAGVGEDVIGEIRSFAGHVGTAFQTIDDLIDQIEDPGVAGKDVDQDVGKATIARLNGTDTARSAGGEHLQQALAALGRSGVASEPISAYVQGIFSRYLGA